MMSKDYAETGHRVPYAYPSRASLSSLRHDFRLAEAMIEAYRTDCEEGRETFDIRRLRVLQAGARAARDVYRYAMKRGAI